MAKGYFITGTDTEVGKSWISAGLITKLVNEGYRVAAMKPVASGCETTADGLRNEDALLLQQCSNVEADYHTINPYHFSEPVAPHIAAANAGVDISFKKIVSHYQSLSNNSDFVIVEGAGGWRVPLGSDGDMSALAGLLDLPVILIVALRLGCINHALLSAEAIRRDGHQFAGWIGNCITSQMNEQQANIETLQQQIPEPCLGVIPYSSSLNPAVIAAHLKIS